MKRLILPAFFLAVLASGFINAEVIKGSPTAYSNGSYVIIRWVSEDETGVLAYKIERESGVSGAWVVLTSNFPTKGNNSSYEFIDENAFRTADTFYQYRISPVYDPSSGRSQDYYNVSVLHSTSGVRRTWGSIKAMFR
jgi:hypothetical protein